VSNASDELRNKGNQNNFPSINHPLMFCPMQPKHKSAMIKALWSSHKQLRSFLGWAKYMRSWKNHDFSYFIDDHINDKLPNQHFIFTIGDEIVGMGSLVPCYTPKDSQISLWVVTGYQGKGIGKAIVDTITSVAFEVWGFKTLYYEHDSQNESSKKLPQKCDFTFSHTRDITKTADNESGFWYSRKKERPDYLPDAISQGRPIENYIVP
jgi:RimJ/RimL family protein N-acetyltransferase